MSKDKKNIAILLAVLAAAFLFLSAGIGVVIASAIMAVGCWVAAK